MFHFFPLFEFYLTFINFSFAFTYYPFLICTILCLLMVNPFVYILQFHINKFYILQNRNHVMKTLLTLYFHSWLLFLRVLLKAFTSIVNSVENGNSSSMPGYIYMHCIMERVKVGMVGPNTEVIVINFSMPLLYGYPYLS